MYAVTEEDFRSLLRRTSEGRFGEWKRYALSLTRNEADADDVVQDAIANTLRRAPELDSEVRVHHYVRRAIRNTALTLLDRRRRFVEDAAPEALDGGHSTALEIMLDSEQQLARRHLTAVLQRKMDELRVEHREVIEHLVLRTPRMKLREVAEMQGVTTPTVHYRLQAALKTLLDLAVAEVPELREGDDDG
ncbi:MAG: sigma-70 family RNA polymerase sigma factor [Acidobacteriota bacterium]|jgi:RNA polymerase sigma-70 factor (ECF subfamily)